MNTIPLEKVFEEIGRLHIQVAAHQQYIAQLEAQLAILKPVQEPPAPAEPQK